MLREYSFRIVLDMHVRFDIISKLCSFMFIQFNFTVGCYVLLNTVGGIDRYIQGPCW